MNLKNEFLYELLFKYLVNWLIYEKRSMPGRNSNKRLYDTLYFEWLRLRCNKFKILLDSPKFNLFS